MDDLEEKSIGELENSEVFCYSSFLAPSLSLSADYDQIERDRIVIFGNLPRSIGISCLIGVHAQLEATRSPTTLFMFFREA